MAIQKYKYVVLAAAALLAAACTGKKSESAEPEPVPLHKDALLFGFNPDTLTTVEYKIKEGDTFSGILAKLDLPSSKAGTVMERSKGKFDVANIRIGANVSAYYYGRDSLNAGDLHYIIYHRDRVRMTLFQVCDSIQVREITRPIVAKEKYVDVSITSALYADIEKAGGNAPLAWELSDIFAWTVNFFALYENDRFRAFYTELECDGQFYKIEQVHFATFTRGKNTKYAIRVDDAGNGRYWDENGKSLKTAFLKAPLNFKRISSKFTYARKHPVTGVVRPHTAVDYSAPTGTPVVALGNGTVIHSGWAGGGGNTIKIDHHNGYVTSYMHLSKYGKGIKRGVNVQQGQVIGYVGSTGLSTGPHLDFRVYKNGTPIDPLKMGAAAGAPLRSARMGELKANREKYMAMLDKFGPEDSGKELPAPEPVAQPDSTATQSAAVQQ